MNEQKLNGFNLRDLTVRHVKAGYPSVHHYAVALEAKLKGRPSAEQFAIVLKDREEAEAKLEAMERDAWWQRMSTEDIAAELSATFDLNLETTRKIADWILADAKEEA